MVAVLSALLLAVSPADRVERTFVFELRSVPVGLLEVELEAPTYRYRSIHLLTRGDGEAKQRTRRLEFSLDPERRHLGRTPETLALLFLPKRLGCEPTFDELTAKVGEVCVTAVDGFRVKGTVSGERFEATYDPQGLLADLKLGHARFRVREGDVPLGRHDVLGEGVPIVGAGAGALRLSPPRPRECHPPGVIVSRSAARALARQVHRELQREAGEIDPPLCTTFVRRYLSLAEPGSAVAVVGLTALEGERRAMPHAWVRVRTAAGTFDLDPTSLEPVTVATHLALGCAPDPGDPALGQLWLDVLFGPSELVRGG